jgi:hypothetical protein
MVVQEAACLLPAFKEKSTRAKELEIYCFTCSLGFTQCLATHMVQKHFLEMEADAKDFIAMIQEKVARRNPDDILNMDRAPIPYL